MSEQTAAVALAALVIAGTALRVAIAADNRGVRYDIDSLEIVARLLTSHPLHVYGALRWPYPGGWLPVLAACRSVADLTGANFDTVVKLPVILADGGLALAVWAGLRLTAPELGPRLRLAAAALVALGPSFVLISAYHGQIDAGATLPAVLGLLAWVHPHTPPARRAVLAGLLIGLGAAVKSVPLFTVLALVPSARSRREAATLVAAAVAVPVLSLLPFLASDGHAVRTALSANKGIPGWGGLSLFAQPGLIDSWLHGRFFTLSGVDRFLLDRQHVIVAAAGLTAGAFALRRRLAPAPAAALVWTVVPLANPNWSYQYIVWTLPFLLLAGRSGILAAAALQLLLALPAAELYFHFGLPGLQWAYLPLAALAWVALAAAAVGFAAARRPGAGLLSARS